MRHRPKKLQLTSATKRRLRLSLFCALCCVVALVGALLNAAGVARAMAGSRTTFHDSPGLLLGGRDAPERTRAPLDPPLVLPADSPRSLATGAGDRR
jgi:hypothetical protein